MQTEIKELNVTIKTLCVDGKKMTVAMLKQIPECVFDESCLVLGKVKYKLEFHDEWLLVVKKSALCKVWFGYVRDKDAIANAQHLYIAV
jgi:hypothetical protein